MAKNRKNRRRTQWIMKILAWTFILALIFGFAANYTLSSIDSLTLSLLILLVVIMIGILFDLVGTAAAAADIAPLNAKAARRVEGAKTGVYLVKNAEQVANFCNDVAGDISGIVSGALAALIVLKILTNLPVPGDELLLNILLTAVVAAITVGGKAWGKTVAINHSTEVILFAGLVITRLGRPFSWFKNRDRNSG